MEYEDFVNLLNPFGSRDLGTALETLEEVRGGYEEKPVHEILFDMMEEWKESIGNIQNEDIDLVALVYEDILQKAKNKILEVTEYNFEDYGGDTAIYTSGNYMCTSYDYSDGAKEELAKKIKKYREELNQDVFCEFLFDSLDI
jgi:hypothetical protein